MPDENGSTWAANAERYDSWFDHPWGRYAFGVERDTVLEAVGDLAGQTVADVGCGTGRLTQALGQRAASVIGIEPDPAMLAIATRSAAGPLICGDGHRLPLRDDTVDSTTALTVCEFTLDPAQIISELARITRPGGQVIVGALNRRSPWGIAKHRQFSEPPWNAARLLSAKELRVIGASHGAVTLRHALYSPGALPRITRWGHLLERTGRRFAPTCGAFTLMSILIPT